LRYLPRLELNICIGLTPNLSGNGAPTIRSAVSIAARNLHVRVWNTTRANRPAAQPHCPGPSDRSARVGRAAFDGCGSRQFGKALL